MKSKLSPTKTTKWIKWLAILPVDGCCWWEEPIPPVLHPRCDALAECHRAGSTRFLLCLVSLLSTLFCFWLNHFLSFNNGISWDGVAYSVMFLRRTRMTSIKVCSPTAVSRKPVCNCPQPSIPKLAVVYGILPLKELCVQLHPAGLQLCDPACGFSWRA